MLKTILLVCGLLALSVSAMADSGVVMQNRQDRVILQMSVLTVRPGEKIGLTVFPYRYDGVVAGVVTDIDARTGAVAVVLIPKSELDRVGPPQSYHDYEKKGLLAKLPASGYRLFKGDVVIVDVTGHFLRDAPRFRIEHPAAPQVRRFSEMRMPIFAVPTASASSSGAPASSAPSSRSPAGVDVENVLRSLPANAAPASQPPSE